MKIKLKTALGRLLMRLGKINICIIDDEEIYFNENLLAMARENGFSNIERHYNLDLTLFADLQKSCRDIVILDIRGVTSPDVAKDGLHAASSLVRNTSSYIVVTSAHQYHLTNRITEIDYVIEDRLLTAVDFLEELTLIVEDYLSKKTSFYKKMIFKVGFALARQGMT